MKTVKTEISDITCADIASTVNSASMFNNDNMQNSNSEAKSFHQVCPSCNKEFESKQLLTRHLLIHSQTGPFPCDYCSEELDDRSTLRNHWRTCHAREGCQTCNTCGESLQSVEAMSKHMDIHERAKKHRCIDCGKAFAYKSDLRKHMIIHTGIRPYVCPICSKTFTRSTNLNKHQRLHSGYRPFTCSQCPRAFSCKGDLVRHQIIHTGVKPFSCSVCTLSFSRKDKLTKHEKIHSKGALLAFTCPVCPATFTRREELTKHSQFAHNGVFLPGIHQMDGFIMYMNELANKEKEKAVPSLDIIQSHSSEKHQDMIDSNSTNCETINFNQPTELSLKPPTNVEQYAIEILNNSGSIAHV